MPTAARKKYGLLVDSKIDEPFIRENRREEEEKDR